MARIAIERLISDDELFVKQKARRSVLTKIAVQYFANTKTKFRIPIKLALEVGF
jgi:hypothetical protein